MFLTNVFNFSVGNFFFKHDKNREQVIPVAMILPSFPFSLKRMVKASIKGFPKLASVSVPVMMDRSSVVLCISLVRNVLLES